MKILIVCEPYFSHMVLVRKIGNELRNRNHHVVYIFPYEMTNLLPSGSSIFGYQKKEMGNSNEGEIGNQREMIRLVEKTLPEFDLMIYDTMFFLGKILAEKFSKPAIRISTTMVYNDELGAEYIENNGGKLYLMQGKKMGKRIAGNYNTKTGNFICEQFVDPPKLTLVCCPKEFQPLNEQFSDENYKFIGDIFDREESESYEFESDCPIIYISFGTVMELYSSYDSFALSTYRMFFEAFKNEPVKVVLSADETLFEKDEIPDNFIVRKWVPQLQVLSKASLFITHGGMNSTMEAILKEVPMLVVPIFGDQIKIAHIVKQLGLGDCMHGTHMTADKIKSIAFEILNNPDKTKAVHEFKLQMKQSMNVVDAANVIENFYQKEAAFVCENIGR